MLLLPFSCLFNTQQQHQQSSGCFTLLCPVSVGTPQQTCPPTGSCVILSEDDDLCNAEGVEEMCRLAPHVKVGPGGGLKHPGGREGGACIGVSCRGGDSRAQGRPPSITRVEPPPPPPQMCRLASHVKDGVGRLEARGGRGRGQPLVRCHCQVHPALLFLRTASPILPSLGCCLEVC